MSNNVGTLIISAIRPQDSADTYPAFYANDGLGGHHQYATMVERDGIPVERRLEGMTCYVAATSTVYVLIGGIANINWTPLSASITGGSQTLSGNASYSGIAACDTINSVYVISHPAINTANFIPVVSLETPGISSTLFVQAITNRQSSNFTVILSDVPTALGYNILWHLSSMSSFISGGSSGATAFTSLTDAPSSYVGHSGDVVKVNSTENGLDFNKFIKGTVTCDTINNIYTISNPRIAITDIPNVTVIAPSLNQTMFATSVADITSGSFKVEMSGIPDVSGYKLSWIII